MLNSKKKKGKEPMKNFSDFYRSLKHAGLAFLLVAAMFSMAAGATTSTTSSEAPQLMFVQIAEDLKVDPAKSTFRLVKVNQQTLYFSDRPQRIAGHLKMADYLKEWTAKAGKDNFGANPPNATLSVYEPGQPDSTVVVVEITNPVVEGADLVYKYKIINGKLPAKGGPTALFVDWIGVGGGVGPGFYGVGVGRRGFGWR
jgi:hypothetical protein